jgi:hypothetical protein
VDAEGPSEGPLKGSGLICLSFRLSFSYISLRDAGCKTRIIHSFIHEIVTGWCGCLLQELRSDPRDKLVWMPPLKEVEELRSG